MSCYRSNGCTKRLASGDVACLLCPRDGEILPPLPPDPDFRPNSNSASGSDSASDSDSDSESDSESASSEDQTDDFGNSGTHLYRMRVEYTETIYYRTYADIAADTEEEARSLVDCIETDSFDSYDSDTTGVTVEECDEIA